MREAVGVFAGVDAFGGTAFEAQVLDVLEEVGRVEDPVADFVAQAERVDLPRVGGNDVVGVGGVDGRVVEGVGRAGAPLVVDAVERADGPAPDVLPVLGGLQAAVAGQEGDFLVDDQLVPGGPAGAGDAEAEITAAAFGFIAMATFMSTAR